MNKQLNDISKLLDSGEYIRPLDILTAQVSQNLDCPEFLIVYARALYLAWRYDEAESILKSLLSSRNAFEAGKLLINLYLDILRFQEALSVAKMLLEQYPSSLIILKLKADTLWRMRKHQESLDLLRESVNIKATNYEEWYLLGIFNLRLANVGSAIDAFIESLRHQPLFKASADGIKLILSSPENRITALSHLQTLSNRSIEHRFWYGKALYWSHHPHLASEEFRLVFENRPDYQSIELEYARILVSEGRLEEANSIIENHPATISGNDTHLALLGRISLQIDNIEKACDLFFTSIWLHDGVECYGELKILANNARQYDRLMSYATRGYSETRSPRSVGLIAQIHRLRCNYSEALKCLDELLKMVPDHRWRDQYTTLRKLTKLTNFRRNIQFLLAPLNPSKLRHFFHTNNRTRFLSEKLELLGCLSQTYAFKGPSKVEIKLGNPCNNNCIGCCYRSPLLIESRQSDEWYSQTIHPLIAQQTIRQLIEEGVQTIRFSGGGEPFMFPGFMDLVKEVLSHGITLIIITNGTLLSKEIIETLFHAQSDVILVISLWAACGETYVRLHPNKTHEDFNRIIDMNDHYVKLKSSRQPTRLKINHAHVLNTLNYTEVKQMLQLGERCGVSTIHYTMMLPQYYQTDQLLCTEDELAILRIDLESVVEKARDLGIHLFNIQQLIHLLSLKSAVLGQFDAVTGSDIPCTIGWSFAMINADSEVHPCVESQRLKIGNLKKDSFLEIWHSDLYSQFRSKISIVPEFRNDPYFSRIECWKKCDHHDDENAIVFQFAQHMKRGWGKLRLKLILNLLSMNNMPSSKDMSSSKSKEPPGSTL